MEEDAPLKRAHDDDDDDDERGWQRRREKEIPPEFSDGNRMLQQQLHEDNKQHADDQKQVRLIHFSFLFMTMMKRMGWKGRREGDSSGIIDYNNFMMMMRTTSYTLMIRKRSLPILLLSFMIFMLPLSHPSFSISIILFFILLLVFDSSFLLFLILIKNHTDI